MRVVGALMLLASAACGVWLAFQNRSVVIRAHVGHAVWTGHLYMVLVFGALLAAWLLLGMAFLTARRRPARRHASRSHRRTQPAPARQQPLAATRRQPVRPPSGYHPYRDTSLDTQPWMRASSR